MFYNPRISPWLFPIFVIEKKKYVNQHLAKQFLYQAFFTQTLLFKQKMQITLGVMDKCRREIIDINF